MTENQRQLARKSKTMAYLQAAYTMLDNARTHSDPEYLDIDRVSALQDTVQQVIDDVFRSMKDHPQ